jgi:membrane-associated phospholipid phosphatase
LISPNSIPIFPQMILLDTGQSGLIERLIRFDHWLFTLINQRWTNRFFDLIFPFLRQAEFWIPLYLFLLFFITMNFGRRGWLWAFSFIMTAVISDLVSSSVVKHIFFRLRPCCSPDIEDQVRFLANYCPYNSSSFTSSHACNHFAMAFFIFLTLKQTSRIWWIVFLWAFLICYAQVYVGIHFPLDVVGGAILGSLIGCLMVLFFKSQFGPLSLKHAA